MRHKNRAVLPSEVLKRTLAQQILMKVLTGALKGKVCGGLKRKLNRFTFAIGVD